MTFTGKISETPADGGANNIGSNASTNLPEVVLSGEGVVVIEPPQLAAAPAAVGSDVTVTKSPRAGDGQCGLVADLVGYGQRPGFIFECESGMRRHILRIRAELEATQLALACAQKTIEQQAVPDEKRYLVADSYIITTDRAEARRHAVQSALDSGQEVVIASLNGAEVVAVQPIWEAA